MVPDNVKDYARKYGFDSVEKVGNWKGYGVYEAYLNPINGIVPPTGLPSYILEKDGTVKSVIGDEAFVIMDELS